MQTTIKEIKEDSAKFIGQEVTLQGWVRSVRESGSVGFIEFNDGSAFANIQVVIGGNLGNFEELKKLTIGSALEVVGVLKESQGKGQSYEISAESVVIIGLADLSNPIQKKRHTFEYLRTVAHLRPRTNTFMAVFRVRSLIAQAIHNFFLDQNFVYVHTPIITGTDAEGAGEMFRVTTKPEKDGDKSKELLGKPTFLTVSGQLAVESFAMSHRNVYTFGPTFRAENSNTARHACEFWMVEPEMAFADLDRLMVVAEDMVKYICKHLKEKAPDELEFFNNFIDDTLLSRIDNLLSSNFEQISYTEAIEILQKSGKTFEIEPKWGEDLATEHERYLTDEVYKKPVFVINYPKGFKAFYMRQNEDGKTVRAMDLLVPGVGELIGGSQREERMDLLEARMKEDGMNLEEYSWYIDTRRFGTFPHAGFGLGFERMVMYVTGMKNIRDVIPYPRTPNSAQY